MQIQLVEERLKQFRSGLRKTDQELFDRLMRFAKQQLQSGVMASSPNPFDSMACAMLTELQRQIQELTTRLDQMQTRLETHVSER